MRNPRRPESLRLPACPIPRPGDNVVWYTDGHRNEGQLVGYSPGARPRVRNKFGNYATLSSFGCVRLANPARTPIPNWTRLKEKALIVDPSDPEVEEFSKLMSKRIPPGPSYGSLIEEIWSRGFEIFLVGGTVRDILAEKPCNDVDLVTSMPLEHARPLLRDMFRSKPSIHSQNGYVRIGGGTHRDPFIDLKLFTHDSPGTPDAVFGTDLALDVLHRDFACNAVYYDPVNQVLIDPTGAGIVDAEALQLTIVSDVGRRTPYQLAQVLVRFFKFLMRGFKATKATCETIHKHFCPCLSSMKGSERVRYVKAQVLGKHPPVDHERLLNELREVMVEFGAGVLWQTHLEPLRSDILL